MIHSQLIFKKTKPGPMIPLGKATQEEDEDEISDYCQDMR